MCALLMMSSEQIVYRLHAHADVTPPNASRYHRNNRGPDTNEIEAIARQDAGCARLSRVPCFGDYLDIRGQQVTRPDVYASDRYDASQKLGEDVRASGGAGLLYDSLRHRAGSNVVAHRPRNVVDIVQTDHFEIAVSAASRIIEIHRLSSGSVSVF
jgi:hypothetical protein